MGDTSKRNLVLLAAAGLVAGLCACGGGSSSTTPVFSTATDPLHTGSSSTDTAALNSADKRIAEYGTEADSSELVQAAAALHGYLAARTAERWAKACTYMAAAAKQGKSASCPQLIAAMWGDMSASRRYELGEAEVHALHTGGGRAILIYRGADRTNYFIPMVSESGNWKIGALAASTAP